MNGCMGTSDIKAIIEKVEQLLAEEELSDKIELAIKELLNVVEALSADKKSNDCGNSSNRKRNPTTRATRMVKVLPVTTTGVIRITRPKSGGSQRRIAR